MLEIERQEVRMLNSRVCDAQWALDSTKDHWVVHDDLVDVTAF